MIDFPRTASHYFGDDDHAESEGRAALLIFGLSAHRHGVAVFEVLRASKVPAPSALGWPKAPGLDEQGIRAAVARGSNLALRCGATSRGKSLLVLDDDHGKGRALLERLGLDEEIDGAPDPTLIVRTGREPGYGRHYYFWIPAPLPSKDRLDLGGGVVVEAKASRKLVIAAGSLHPSGNRYEIVSQPVLDYDDPFASVEDAPAVLLAALQPVRRQQPVHDERPSLRLGGIPRLVAALRRALDAIYGALTQRNNAICRAAYLVGTVAAHADEDARASARWHLVAAAVTACPDESAKAAETAGRAFDNGLKNPAPERGRTNR